MKHLVKAFSTLSKIEWESTGNYFHDFRCSVPGCRKIARFVASSGKTASYTYWEQMYYKLFASKRVCPMHKQMLEKFDGTLNDRMFLP